MNEYIVKKAFEGHAVGDVILLNSRQAKYLLLSGHIKLKSAEKPKTEVK
ncbi:hypothetical protein [Methylobacter tundripaludum]|uniref:Uncharacterized protein n=1 Tax=Methylobacter tundripaludum (strain ATCC BAA-1195 / DSM 17260 / SV96) TaxID=697282 RepID=G3IRF9_METTV|nr:hypothetical protein [Methylobacter tundripaludum]EGW22170.1 hypothetical protein Mettu_0971 [Methylobacter tundripaludum SV96]